MSSSFSFEHRVRPVFLDRGDHPRGKCKKTPRIGVKPSAAKLEY